VDDPDDNRELLALAFRAEGFRVFVAESMTAGLAWLRSGASIDFVVTDYWLGDGVGERMLRQAYEEGLMRGVGGALICTSHGSVEASSYARVVHEPIGPRDLVALVRRLLLA
jgi:DNA-binding NtrC family response regulator